MAMPDNIIKLKQEGNEPAQVYMFVSPWMEKEFKGEPFDLDLEMMRAERRQVNGMIELRFTVQDETKIRMLVEFIQLLQIDVIFGSN